MKKVLPDKVYNVLKWTALIALPAIGIFYEELAEIWSLPFGSQIHSTCSILAVLIGALIAKSTVNYNKNKGE